MDGQWMTISLHRAIDKKTTRKNLKYDFTIEARLLLRLASKDEIVIGVQSEFLWNSG
jgi:hypothetical protein